jgi:nucleoside-diphosphate-sugar epimerase
MRVLLTGASGFVGAEILRVLKRTGHDVVLATRRPDAAIAGFETRIMPDLGMLDAGQALKLLDGAEALIHSAGHAHAGPDSDPAIHAAVNARGTRLLAEAAAEAGVRMVFLSSIKAMGAADEAGFLHEDNLRPPEDAYGRSKREAEDAIRAALPGRHVILRPSLVAGPGVKGNLAMLLRLASLRVPLPFADVAAHRSMISLSDLADIAVRAITESGWSGRSLIVADPVPVTLPEIVTAMRAGLGRKPGLFSVPEPMLSASLSLLGRAGWAERLFSPLVAAPAFLIGQGWQPSQPVLQALFELAQRRSA